LYGRRVELETVVRDDVPIVYAAELGTPDDVGGAASRAFARLEAAIPPKGRKMYGYWDPPSRRYLACYELAEGERPEELGLERGVIPGGAYRRVRLKGEGVFARIGETFDALAKDDAVDGDSGRPWFEFYRRHDEVDLFVPASVDAETG
jgi:hypothetical protein